MIDSEKNKVLVAVDLYSLEFNNDKGNDKDSITCLKFWKKMNPILKCDVYIILYHKRILLYI